MLQPPLPFEAEDKSMIRLGDRDKWARFTFLPAQTEPFVPNESHWGVVFFRLCLPRRKTYISGRHTRRSMWVIWSTVCGLNIDEFSYKYLAFTEMFRNGEYKTFLNYIYNF